VKCAPEVFNERFRQIFENIVIYIDDIIIWGKSKSDHDKTLNKVLDIAKNYNIKFNLKKCKPGATEKKFFYFAPTSITQSV
jgi:hypothetical protein